MGFSFVVMRSSLKHRNWTRKSADNHVAISSGSAVKQESEAIFSLNCMCVILEACIQFESVAGQHNVVDVSEQIQC